MKAQHKASIEKVMQSSFKHKRAGTEITTAILGIEAMTVSGIDTTAVAENSDKKVLGRCRAAVCHKAIGKRMADAISTLEKIIADEAIVVVAEDKELSGAPHKAKMRRQSSMTVAQSILGEQVSDTIDKAEKVVDELITIYGTLGGAAGADGLKANAITEANLVAIKAIMEL
jgi:hypothetical protein